MSLFDDNYLIALEQDEAKAEDTKKKADKADDEDAEGADPEAEEECKEDGDAGDAELSDEDKEKVDDAVDADIKADTPKEATGFDSLVREDFDNAHYACLEAVTALVEFDRKDIACTEAYTSATTEYEKQVVTETFKESVKNFAARFKDFLVKIKNAILRIVNKAINYIRVLASRITAHFASKIKLDKSKPVPDEVTVRISDVLAKKFSEVVKDISHAGGMPQDKLISIINSISSQPWEANVVKIKDVKVPNKKDLMNEALGLSGNNAQGWHDVKLSTLQSKGDEYLKDLGTVKDNAKFINEWRKNMETMLKTCEKAAKSGKDIESKKLNLITSAVSKAMSCFNSQVSAMTSIQSMWINQRVKIVKALNKYQGMTDYKPEKGKERIYFDDQGNEIKESAMLFADFFDMIG